MFFFRIIINNPSDPRDFSALVGLGLRLVAYCYYGLGLNFQNGLLLICGCLPREENTSQIKLNTITRSLGDAT